MITGVKTIMGMPQSISELERIKKECISIVNKRAIASGTISAVPVPGIDVAADVAMLIELMKNINNRFGLSSEEVEKMDEMSKQIVFNIVKQSGKIAVQKGIEKLGGKAAKQAMVKVATSMLAKQAGKQTTKQFSKFIPFIGQAAAAGIGFTAMKIAGHQHINDCYEIVKRVIEKKSYQSNY